MKQGWTYKKLEEVCEVLDSQRKPITKSKRESGNIPYYGATGLLDYVKDFLFDEKLVLLGEDGAKWGAGETSAYIIEGKSWINNHAHALRPKRNQLVDELLVYYLNFSNLLPYITGVTVPKLNQEKMRSIDIPLPPLSEQQRIVSRLDSAFAHIDELKANAEKQVNEARALFQKALSKAMEPKEGWTYKKLGEVCEIFGRIGFRGYTKGDFVDSPKDGAITLSPSNIVNGEMDFKKCSYITWAKYEESPEIMIYPGDILLVKTASVGKTAIVKNLPHKATINPQFVVLKNINVNNYFLSYFLKSEKAQNYIWSIAKGAAAQTVSQKNLAEMQVPIVHSIEQQRIVSRLDSLSKNVKALEENQRKVMAECDALKQALLRKVFE